MIRGNICVNNIDGIPLCFASISANYTDTFTSNPTTSISNMTIHSHYNVESKSRILMAYTNNSKIDLTNKENIKDNKSNKIYVKAEAKNPSDRFKFVMIVHGNCSSDCSCQNFATNFLFHVAEENNESKNDIDKFCDKNFNFLTHLKNPLLIILFDHDQLYSLSYYASNEFFVKKHPLGSYIIK